MAKRIQSTIALIAFTVIWAIFVPSAFAQNAHQDHQGACARSTTSISKGVTDLGFNGVRSEFASALGIRGVNGSIPKQMKEQLVIGVVKHAVTTDNTGCDGNGGTFDAGSRELRTGEAVAVKVPAKIGNSACKHPSSKCKRVVIVVNVVMPASCWNLNRGRVEVVIWVHKKPHKPHKQHKKPKQHKKKPPIKKVCSGNTTNQNVGTAAQGGNCSENTNITVCSPVNSPGSVVCTSESPPALVNKLPQISCVFQPHIYVGENFPMWCEASDPDGDTLSVKIEGDSHVTVSGQIPVNERWDASPCPSGVSCFRATLWGKSPGMGHIVATVTANGESAKAEGDIEVLKDEF